MIYRMLTSVAIWLATSVIVVTGKLQDRDLQVVVAAATISTIAAWALQPASSSELSKRGDSRHGTT
jgi:hypothetical protein